jgi:hypothetical protein
MIPKRLLKVKRDHNTAGDEPSQNYAAAKQKFADQNKTLLGLAQLDIVENEAWKFKFSP